MSKKDVLAEYTSVLERINGNLANNEMNFRMVGVSFVKRGDFTLCVVQALTNDITRPKPITGFGFSKRHPEDHSDREVAYEYSFKRAIEDVFHIYSKIAEVEVLGFLRPMPEFQQ